MKAGEIPELLEFFGLLVMVSTPDGRWSAVQEFIKRDAKWTKREKDMLETLPEDAPRIVCRWIDLPPSLIPFFDQNGELQRQAINGFRIAQEMYKERKELEKHA